jgi:hypothetical protein
MKGSVPARQNVIAHTLYLLQINVIYAKLFLLYLFNHIPMEESERMICKEHVCSIYCVIINRE